MTNKGRRCLTPVFAAVFWNSGLLSALSRASNKRGQHSFSPVTTAPSTSTSTAYNAFLVVYQSALCSKVLSHPHMLNLLLSVQDFKYKLTHDSLPLHRTGSQLRTTPRQEH